MHVQRICGFVISAMLLVSAIQGIIADEIEDHDDGVYFTAALTRRAIFILILNMAYIACRWPSSENSNSPLTVAEIVLNEIYFILLFPWVSSTIPGELFHGLGILLAIWWVYIFWQHGEPMRHYKIGTVQKSTRTPITPLETTTPATARLSTGLLFRPAPQPPIV